MKKLGRNLGRKLGTLTLTLALLALTTAPAFARGIGVDVDGKCYTFSMDSENIGADGFARYEVDSRTFLIGTDEVVVQEPGKPDRHLSLEDEVSQDVASVKGVKGTPAYSSVTVQDGEISIAYGDGAQFAQTESSAIATEDAYLIRDWGIWDAQEYAVFAPYGLSCDAEAGKLYYMGRAVRVFEDAYPVDGGLAELNYFDTVGVVDVRVKRNESGKLTGLEALSEAEFAARDLREWTDPEPVRGEATTEGEASPEEKVALYAPYAPFGLRYDTKMDAFYYGDKPVRSFLDVRSSNGESMSGGKFKGTITQYSGEGEVDVTAIRDYTQLDAIGEGKLIGMEVSDADDC